MNIRNMTREDVPEVAAQEKIIFSDYWTEEGFLESLQNENAYMIVVTDEQDALMGYACVYRALDEAELMNIATVPAFRRQHVGDEMLTHLKAYLKARDVHYFYLEVRESNIAAKRLYEKYGFETMGLRKNFYDNPKEHAWVMTCEI